MKFIVKDSYTTKKHLAIDFPQVVLSRIEWNDFGYLTTFSLSFFSDDYDEGISLGRVRIMKLGQRKGEATFSDMIFEQLKDPDLYCSLGEELSYYQRISKLPLKVRNKILSTLGDLVYDRSRIGKFEGDECYKLSLLRDQSSLEALETAGSRYFGQIEKKNLEFVAKFSIFGDTAHHLNFDFNEHRGLPHRVNLIIGSNAVGKTQVLAKLAQAMTRFAPDKEAKKSVKDTIRDGEISPYPSLFNVIAISYSAFDNFKIPSKSDSDKIRYSYLGLRKKNGDLKSEADLSLEIKKSIGLLRDKKLEIVTRFLTKIVRIEESWSLDEGIESFPYERLSSGQKIATHTIVGVLRTISDYSLVLIDEPETHLHPRLLSSMYFSLLDILHEFNSVSIIASHSQLLAQQVPSRYIQVLRRYDDTIIVQRPSIEFFGADMSQICEEVFRRREDERDFESVLDALLSQNSNSPEKVEKIFDKRLGLAASIYLRSKAEEVKSEKS